MLKHRHHSVSGSSDSLLVPMAAEPSGVLGTSVAAKRSSLTNGKRRDDSTSCFPKLLLMLALMVGSAFGSYLYFKTFVLEQIQAQHRSEIERDQSQAKEFSAKLTRIEAERKRIEQELSGSQAKAKDLEAALESAQHPDTSDLDTKITQLVEYKKRIQRSIQQYARRQMLEKYGPGPHRVEIQLAFDPASNVFDAEGGDRIVIEMAPIADMPYTVWWFLSQVERGLYDMTSFHRNAGHVVQGGPAANFLTPPDSHLVKRFEDSGFDSVIFQEYSANFPHNKYTLGYAGRPGGPDFYISTINNVENHGPGGQGSYDDPSEADPCFAKVIEGFEAVERMHKSSVKPGNYKRMEHFVAIKSMRLLRKIESVAAEA